MSTHCSISFGYVFVQSSNVVYPALPSFFVISEISWGRFLDGTVRILQSRICSEVGRTCPCNHGVFPSFNLVGKIVRFQPSVFLLSCKRILLDKVGGYTQGQGAWTNLSTRWRYRRRRVPINYLTVGNCMVCHPPSRGTHGGSASLGGFSICRPTVQFRSVTFCTIFKCCLSRSAKFFRDIRNSLGTVP